jgi:hypothetical protein
MSKVQQTKDKIDKQRARENAANDALKKLDNLHAPKPAKDEVKDLRKALKGTAHEAENDIERLRKHLAELRNPKGGPDEVVTWLKKVADTTESPYGSNLGPFPITECQLFTGYHVPDANGKGVFWCGCLACYAVVKIGGAGITYPIRMGYGPSIIADAKAGANGFHAVPFSQAQAGDVLVYWGGEHIGVAIDKPSGSTIKTGEGNTSSADGSQSNGGGIYLKTRTSADVTIVARPVYAH